MIKGINVLNPVEVDKDYLLFAVEYAHKNGFNHIQINGPIHNPVIGNIDGMTPYRKYDVFDSGKDSGYIKKSIDAINSACSKAKEYGIKVYVWHHELELPSDFAMNYPEVCNEYGDIEVSHPLVRDFLENKISDFFHFYPDVHGIVLTLHETKIPLLKLKKQKLPKLQRVKYVTEILWESCRRHGKELIVRPFASISEDYEMMTKAYEEISLDLPIMDKWTQFDWSLTLPHNSFFEKIRKNPLLVETDIFGEYFGKGRLPIMLENHLKEKFSYCGTFSPVGYVNRVDRGGNHPFGDVNEVNIKMTLAYLNGEDPKKAAMAFFEEKYKGLGKEVYELMEKTEDIQIKTLYLKGYYFSELSLFPTLNHSKNHFYFEQMRKDCLIASEEWFIPKDWKRVEPSCLLEEKKTAVCDAERLLKKLSLLEDRMDKEEYGKLWTKFKNLELITRAWYCLTSAFINYVKFFEGQEESFEASLFEDIKTLSDIRNEGKMALGNDFYCIWEGANPHGGTLFKDCIEEFTDALKASFEIEKKTTASLLSDKSLTDFVVCGGAMEGHGLKKEVNFSDTVIRDGRLSRIPGNSRGAAWSSINAHGWFSYSIKVKPEKENIIKVFAGSSSGKLCMQVTLGEAVHEIQEDAASEKELTFSYMAGTEDKVRIRFDKISSHVPYIYTITSTAK